MGVLNSANVLSARALSRQAMAQANQALLAVDQQVRTGFINVITSKRRIDESAAAAAAAKDVLKFAHLRLSSGVGTNLEVIQAQRDYINALSAQARAIVASNQAQAVLLYATGAISLESLTSGYSGKAPAKKRPGN